MSPFSTDPESFGQRILCQPQYRYMTIAEFDELTENPNPLANILGPDTEVLYIEALDLKRPQNSPKRTYITGDTSPVGKWARWVESWRAHGREFDGAHPDSHSGEFAWIALKQVPMGKRGTHEVWLYDGVPSPEEIASLPAVGAGRAVTQPSAPEPEQVSAYSPVDARTLEEAILMVTADGITPIALFALVDEMVMTKVPREQLIAKRDALLKIGALKSEGGKLHATS